MLCASHHCTLPGAGVGEGSTGDAVGLDWTKLNRLGLHCLSTVRRMHKDYWLFLLYLWNKAGWRLLGLTGVVGHGWPGEVHGVKGDNGSLEEAWGGLSLLWANGAERRFNMAEPTGDTPISLPKKVWSQLLTQIQSSFIYFASFPSHQHFTATLADHLNVFCISSFVSCEL